MTTPTGPGITAPQAPTQVGNVRTQNPVGQNLTPNPNVFAIMQMGGDTDQTGYLKPAVITPSTCESATNYLDPGLSTTNRPAPGSRLGRLNNDALPGQTNDPLSGVGNNAG